MSNKAHLRHDVEESTVSRKRETLGDRLYEQRDQWSTSLPSALEPISDRLASSLEDPRVARALLHHRIHGEPRGGEEEGNDLLVLAKALKDRREAVDEGGDLGVRAADGVARGGRERARRRGRGRVREEVDLRL